MGEKLSLCWDEAKVCGWSSRFGRKTISALYNSVSTHTTRTPHKETFLRRHESLPVSSFGGKSIWIFGVQHTLVLRLHTIRKPFSVLRRHKSFCRALALDENLSALAAPYIKLFDFIIKPAHIFPTNLSKHRHRRNVTSHHSLSLFF